MATNPQPPPPPSPRRPIISKDPLSRRALLRSASASLGAMGLSALLAACGRHGHSPTPGPAPSGAGSLAALAQDAVQLSFLGAQSQLPVGGNLVTFGLSTPDNRLLTGGSPQLWVARDQTSKPLGPIATRWQELTAYAATKDTSPRSDLTGFYAAEVDFPAAGNWLLAAVTQANGRRAAGSGAVPIVAGPVVAQVGSKALAVPTPVATSPAALGRVCTRTPPCPMHAISLDAALRGGRPTVVVFATPLLCQSRMCGPVVDEALVAAKTTATGKANFVHVEIYPQRDATKPAPAFHRWGFQTEPWTIVIDRRGSVWARFEGPVVTAEIEAALRPLQASP